MGIKMLDTLSGRLQFAMEKEGFSQAALARAIGIRAAALQYLLSSKAQASRFTFELAHALNVRPEWLATGTGPMAFEDDPMYKIMVKYRPIPILNITDTLTWKDFNDSKADSNVVVIEKELGENIFAFRIPDAAMRPVFCKDNIVVVDADRTPKDNDLVVGIISSQKEIMFRQLSLSDEGNTLVPYNLELYKPITLTKEDRILGVAIEVKSILNP